MRGIEFQRIVDALLAEVRASGVFTDVREIRIRELDAFVDRVPDVQVPACLILRKTRRDRGHDVPISRTHGFSALLVAPVAPADGEKGIAALEDAFDRILGREILGGDVWIHGGGNSAVIPIEDNTLVDVVEVAFEAEERVEDDSTVMGG